MLCMKAVTCLLCQKMNLCQLFNTEFFKEAVLTACEHCPQKNGSGLIAEKWRKDRIRIADAADLQHFLFTENDHHLTLPS